jgi:N-acetylmuramoyl-L-alanine amidase
VKVDEAAAGKRERRESESTLQRARNDVANGQLVDGAPRAISSRSTSSSKNASSSDVPLTYETVNGKQFAIYRLQRGEALYSSVAVRFTGRVYAKDVNDAVDAIVDATGIPDVARIAVDAPIRIPLEMLTPDYLPAGDGRRVAYESSKRASARAAKRVEARNLRGVLIVIDAGHGGRDVGTLHDELWESTYVYDVACRIKQIIEKNSDAKVALTTKSKTGGYTPSFRDLPSNRTDHVVLTTPEYELEDASVGVNLRWYLANSIYRNALASSILPEKVIFLSIHADSLHPSIRGAMAYIPGQEYSRGSFTKKGKIYLTRAEVREMPVVSQSDEEALRAEGLSNDLAQSIIGAIEEAALPVHDFKPVRENVVRDGKEWVPAVIRYNKIPTRLLLEICNLGNEDDRELIRTKKYRQALASAIYAGIEDFFSERKAAPSNASSGVAASR